MQTIREAIDFLTKHIFEGVRCPCCKQTVKVYRRRLDKGKAKLLIKFYKADRHASGERWLHVKRDIFGGHDASGEHAKLRYWGLLEERAPRSGEWRITDDGRRFVEGMLKVPCAAFTYNGDMLKLDDKEMIDIQKALGRPFDFRKEWNI